MKADGNFDLPKMREYIKELKRLMAKKPQFDPDSATIIINKLIAGIEYSVNTVEFMKKQEELERFQKLGMGSHARN